MGEISDALGRARKEEEAQRSASSRAPRRAPEPSRTPPPPSRPAPAPSPPRGEERSAPEPPVRAEPVEPAEPAPWLDTPAPAEASDVAQAMRATAERRTTSRIVIPRDHHEGWIERLCLVDTTSPFSVQFRHFAVKMRALLDQRPRQSLLVTSALASEGKTSVASNLALALASIAPEYKVALVDLDLHRGRLREVFRCDEPVGVEAVLRGDVAIEDACIETDLPSLDLYPTRSATRDAQGLLGIPAASLLRELAARYDYVICDGPPVLPVPDVPMLANEVGGCLAVAAAGRTRHRSFKRLTEIVPRSAWLGVFLNETRVSKSESQYGYYAYEIVDDAEAEGVAEVDEKEDTLPVGEVLS